MGPDSEMETFLASNLDEVLVGADTGGFESLRAQLLIFVGDEVDAEREVVDRRTLSAEIEDANLGVGDTTVEPRLGIRLHGELVSSPPAFQSPGIGDGLILQRVDSRRTLFLQYR
jgi:hypothetical protein